LFHRNKDKNTECLLSKVVLKPVERSGTSRRELFLDQIVCDNKEVTLSCV